MPIEKAFVGFWNITCEIAPYLLVSFLLSGILKVFAGDKFANRSDSFSDLLKAAVSGLFTPVCSCQIAQKLQSLRQDKTTPANITSAIVSTPQNNLQIMAVTYGLCGWLLTLFRFCIVMTSGLLSGIAVKHLIAPSALPQSPDTVTSGKPQASCCGNTPQDKFSLAKVRLTHPQKKTQSAFSQILMHAFVEIPETIAKRLLIGIILAVLLTALLPENIFAQYLGTGILSLLAVVLLSFFLPLCAITATPLAVAWLHAGAAPGTILVFLVLAPSMNLLNLMTFRKYLGWKATGLLLTVSIATAFIAGILANGVSASVTLQTVTSAHELPLIKILSGAAILLLLFYQIRPREKKCCH